MEEYESFKLPCSIGHLLIFVGYVIFGGIYLVQLWDSMIERMASSSARSEAMALVALTENELRGRPKDDVLDLLSRTRYSARKSCRCVHYMMVDLFFREGIFVSYDLDASSIGDSNALNGPCTKPCRKEDWQ
jgi:hypothetical protein